MVAEFFKVVTPTDNSVGVTKHKNGDSINIFLGNFIFNDFSQLFIPKYS